MSYSGYVPRIFKVLIIASAIPASAMASEICSQKHVVSSGDAVSSLESDTFVIADKCVSDQLIKLPRQILAVRIPHNNPIDSTLSETPPPAPDVVAKFNCIHPPIVFPRNSASLQKSHQEQLNVLSKSLSPGEQLQITGYTCDLGTTLHNLKLSKKRARTVAKYLRGRGADVVEVVGKGECCPVSTVKSLNRRVEIESKGVRQ